ncbi:Arc family DNA-binding protein [Mesorhizobium qingshengii]|uniref:Arc family DNA-binding protein n=1 Tax=Mesorhizobium qingshengii TaxID=1165689 RepID=A0ABT4QTY2_9HYPH|nr:Arc family DNA-binding protein [Mesorhizobium qingshengii]MCZ8545039.1 Arc family DNA-binding protein [Mesorhizobium qingshengii]
MPKTDRLTSHIRLSSALKRRLKVAAAENGRSLNEEVVLRLEGSFEIDASQRERLKLLLANAQAVLDGG